MRDTQRSEIISTQLRQIAAQASEHPERVFTSLIHRMDVDFLREAYYRLRKDGAPGLSGIHYQTLFSNLTYVIIHCFCLTIYSTGKASLY